MFAKAIANKSPATIRNDLKILEELGYLKQLHTSGGRVPTTKGYRIYVNHLFSTLQLNSGELAVAADRIASRTATIPQLIEEVCKKIETQIDYPILVKQNYGQLIIEELRLLNLLEGNTLCLIRTLSGSIQFNIIGNYSQSECDDVSSALNSHFKQKTLAEMFENLNGHINEIKKELKSFTKLCKNLAENLESFIDGSNTRGAVKLLSHHENLEQIKDITKIIENKEKVEEVLSKSGVIIGNESGQVELEGSSIISIDCEVGGKNVAKLGILGPERMDYKKLLTALFALVSQTESAMQLQETKKLKEKKE
ncbi:MAG: hypothetical protein FWD32_01710 [Firmicutes bacterium]|nr:hypothetical protein [Bacillota bacterium]